MYSPIFFGLVILSCLVALTNWKAGLYCAILLDVLRDPIRKLTPTHPIMITVIVGAVWFCVLVGLTLRRYPVRELLRSYPDLRRVVTLLILALIPGAVISVVSYQLGWLLALVGVISYLSALIAIPIGFELGHDPRELIRVMWFYCIVNSLALIGTPLEYAGIEHVVLGGMDVDWVRYRTGYTVDLITGIYRSPDVMGIHAAFVVGFCGILIFSQPRHRVKLMALAGWASSCLLLSGRRKMIGMPVAFLATLLLLSYLAGHRASRQVAGIVSVLLFIAAAVLFGSQDDEVGNEYTEFAATIFTEGLQRTNTLVGDSVGSTIDQLGFLGSGLGSATQGKYHLGIRKNGNWQEDGVSRLFAELGMVGVVLMSMVVIMMFGVLRRVFRAVSSFSPYWTLLASCLAFLMANLASFIVSHQIYSGDPCTVLLVALVLGVVFALPRLDSHLRRQTVQRSLAEQKRMIPTSTQQTA